MEILSAVLEGVGAISEEADVAKLGHAPKALGKVGELWEDSMGDGAINFGGGSNFKRLGRDLSDSILGAGRKGIHAAGRSVIDAVEGPFSEGAGKLLGRAKPHLGTAAKVGMIGLGSFNAVENLNKMIDGSNQEPTTVNISGAPARYMY